MSSTNEEFRPVSVTVKGAARMTGLGESTVWALLADGRLQGTSIGRRRLVLVSSIETLLGISEAATDSRRVA